MFLSFKFMLSNWAAVCALEFLRFWGRLLNLRLSSFDYRIRQASLGRTLTCQWNWRKLSLSITYHISMRTWRGVTSSSQLSSRGLKHALVVVEFMWKRSPGASLLSKTEGWRCEPEASVREVPLALTSLCFDTSLLWHPFPLASHFDLFCCDIPLLEL